MSISEQRGASNESYAIPEGRPDISQTKHEEHTLRQILDEMKEQTALLQQIEISVRTLRNHAVDGQAVGLKINETKL